MSALIRVSCGLSNSSEDTSELLIRVRVRDADEEAVVTDFLKSYQRRRNLADDIAARLRDRAPLLHPAELFRAIVGLPAAKVGAPEGNQNHSGKPGANQHTVKASKKARQRGLSALKPPSAAPQSQPPPARVLPADRTSV